MCITAGMGRRKEKIREEQLQGFKYFKPLSTMLESLHDVGCARDRAGNRTLHMDQYISLLLLYMFNPICTSLRSLQQASELKKVQKTLGVARASLGSLSEAARVFDSAVLKDVIEELSGRLGTVRRIGGLPSEPVLTAVDGTLIEAVGKMAWASWRQDRNGVKIHYQYEILKGVPVAMSVTDANTSETAVLEEMLAAGRFYVLDRGYAKYSLLQKIQDARSSFVCRIRDNAVYEILEERPLSAEAREAGIVFDRVVELGSAKAAHRLRPVRVVAVRCTPHTKRGHTARGGPAQKETLLIVTDRLDLEPETVATIYRYRWTIEIYFRFFKHVLGCRHLLSHSENGIELQMYAAIIACMLIALWTGRKPTLRTYEMVCWYFTGMADEEELHAHIARLRPQP
mgnify:CR=1 FL=1